MQPKSKSPASDPPTVGAHNAQNLTPSPADKHTPLWRALSRTNSQRWCGRGAIVGVSPDESQVVIVPLRCKSWDCPKCGPRKAAQAAARIASGNPNKFLTLTIRLEEGMSTERLFENAKAAFPKLIKRIRRKVPSFEYALVWELTKNGAPHAHIAARSEFIPQRWLSNTWKELTGSNVVDIRSIRNAARTATYVTKYMLKSPYQTTAALEGRKLIQFSKDYLPKDNGWTPPEVRQDWSWTWVDEDLNRLLSTLPTELILADTVLDNDTVLTFTLPRGPSPPPQVFVSREGIDVFHPRADTPDTDDLSQEQARLFDTHI